jgi:acyl-CoA synthetase (AMP-forming)/AMP-acid ligase II
MDTQAATIAELIDWSVDRYANTLAIADGENRLTYTKLGRLIDQAARAMVEHGIKAGDAVSVWAPNCWEWVVASLAVSRTGAVLVPVNTRFKGSEAAYVLTAAKVRMLFVANGFLGTDYGASLNGQDITNLEHIIDMASNFNDFMASGQTLVHQAEVDRRSAAAAVDDINVIMFTSGTTGLPKGVQIRGSAIIRAFDRCANEFGVSEGDPYLQVNPYFHAFGYNCGLIVCLLNGATNVPVATFEPSAILELIQTERIAVFPGPPAIFQSLLNQPDLDAYDLSSLRGCLTGAATIPVEMVVAMKERLGFTTVITAYGMTETSGLAAYCRADDPPQIIAKTSGRAGPDMELAIVDEELNEVPRGTEGELLVRGFQVTPGYLDAPQKTAETITSEG